MVIQMKRKILDETDAPPGYYAVLKSDVQHPYNNSNENICRKCNWKNDCNGFKYRCMPHEIITRRGSVLCRKYGCSVVFKRLKDKI